MTIRVVLKRGLGLCKDIKDIKEINNIMDDHINKDNLVSSIEEKKHKF